MDGLRPARCRPRDAYLVIEVDGGYHVTRAGADGRRTQQLARLGYRVLRLEAAVVLANPAVALAVVQAALLE